jgi:hypothetical protein
VGERIKTEIPLRICGRGLDLTSEWPLSVEATADTNGVGPPFPSWGGHRSAALTQVAVRAVGDIRIVDLALGNRQGAQDARWARGALAAQAVRTRRRAVVAWEAKEGGVGFI